MPQSIYIFRHGLATHSKEGYGDEILTARVLPEGIPPIERMAEYLKNVSSDFSVSSEILRCRQTAEIVEKIAGHRFAADKRLNEYHQESFEQFRKRVQLFVNEIRGSSHETILICTHGAVMAGIKNLLLNSMFTENMLPDYVDTGVLLTIKGKYVSLLDFNSVGK